MTKISLLAAACVASCLAFTAKAQVFEVIHPEIEAGGFELEALNGVVLDSVGVGEERSVHELALGYAPFSFWKTTLAVELANARQGGVAAEALEWENVFLFPIGGHGHGHGGHGHKHGDDGFFSLGAIGFYAALEIPQEGGIGAGGAALGPIAEVELGPAEVVANLFVEIPFENGADPGIAYAFSAAVPVYESDPISLAVGGEIHGGFEGAFGDAVRGDQNSHVVGPAIYSAFDLGNDRELEPRLALLFGLTEGSPDAALSFNIELKF